MKGRACEDFEGPPFKLIDRNEHLLATGQLDQKHRWKRGQGNASAEIIQ